MDLELLLAKNNFTTDDKNFLEDFVRTDENNSLKFGANNDPDLTQVMEDLEGRIIGRQSEISIYCFYSILCLYIVVILIGSMGNILVLIAVFGRKSMSTNLADLSHIQKIISETKKSSIFHQKTALEPKHVQ